MSAAHAELLHLLCIALRESCTGPTLARVWEVLSRLSVAQYRLLIHERFGGRLVLLQGEPPAHLTDDQKHAWRSWIATMRRLEEAE